MKPTHVLLALLVTAVWGFNFVVIALGLHTVPPFLLAGLRFMIAALPVFVLPRPTIPWSRLLSIGATLFLVQFALLFTAMTQGMPPGMASVIAQAQALFTPVLAAVMLHERPSIRHVVGIGIALVGLGVIGTTAGSGGLSALGVALTLAAALSWSVGNVQLRLVGEQNMLALVAWLSLVPLAPMFVLSLVFEGGPHVFVHTIANMGWMGVGAVLYIGVLSTLLGYGIWAYLLKLHRATTVAPFSLLVPVFGAASASLVVGEEFGPKRLAGMALILAGLAIIALPRRLRTRVAAPSPLIESGGS